MLRMAMAAVVMVCVARAGWAEVVDLSRPFEADGATIQLFHMEDVASGEIKDAVAGGKAGKVTEMMPTLGRFGGGMSCDGVKGWVDVGDLAKTEGPTALTVECWVKFREKVGGDIICRNDKYMMRIAGTVNAYFGIDGNWRIVKGAKAIPVDKWTHVAMTYDQKSKEIRIYVNGALDIAEVPKGITEGKLNAGDSMLRLGTNTWSAGSARMDGKMDELRISSVAREYRPIAGLGEMPVAENTNLVTNPGFESGMYGWRVNMERNALLLWGVEKGNAPQGRAILKAKVEAAPAVMSYPFRIVRGKRHTVSAMMRAETPCKGTLALVCTGTSAGTPEKRVSQEVAVTGEWKRYSAKFDIPTEWPSGKAYVEIGTGEKTKLEIDAVNVVVGEETGYTQTEAESIGIAAALPTQSTYMFEVGKALPALLPVEITNAGEREKEVAVEYAIVDWQGRVIKQGGMGTKKLAPGQATNWVMDIPNDRVGWYEVKFTVKQGENVFKETSRVFNVIEPMKGVGDVEGSPIGMNTHMEREPNEHLDCNLGMLSLCGVKWIRAWWGWGMAEKEEGKFDWTEYDRQMEAVHRAGMEIMPILLRYYQQYEQAWAGPVDKIERAPNSLVQWGNYVRTTAEHYRGKVKVWEIWNEPVFSMKPEEYAKLLKVSYDAIKGVDAKALVVGGGGVGHDYLDKVCEAGTVKEMDVMSDHPYSHIGRPFAQLLEKAQWLAPVQERYPTLTKRVWYTEQGTQADEIGYIVTGQSEKDCATNLVQSYLSAMSMGVEKFFWFSGQTTPRYGWAVYYENYVPRPRLVALNGLARMLKERKVTGRMTLGEGKVACVLMDGKGGAAAALWNLEDAVKVRLAGGTEATLADMLGNAMENPGEGGAVELRMGQPVYVVAKKEGVAALTEALGKAKVEVLVPVEVKAAKGADGNLEVTVHNQGNRNMDVRVSVESPGLFTETPRAVSMVDLGGQETRKAVFAVTKRPGAGTEATVRVKVELGTHGVSERVEEVKVKF